MDADIHVNGCPSAFHADEGVRAPFLRLLEFFAATPLFVWFRHFVVFKPALQGYSAGMSYVTVEVEIDHGRVVPREPERLPEKGNGLLTILQPVAGQVAAVKPPRQRVVLPLIRGDGKRIINPTPEELDASFWGD